MSQAPLYPKTLWRRTNTRPGSLNRVPASAGVKTGKSPLPGGR